MAKAKYIVLFFLFLAAFLFIGESYSFFMENFQDSYTQVGYFLSAGDSALEMKHQISEQAKAYKTTVFALEKPDSGVFLRRIIIYADQGARERLKKDWGIEEGSVKSFFSGRTEFIFKAFAEASEEVLQNCWYPDRSRAELHPMLYPGMVQYSAAFRNDPIRSSATYAVLAVWLIVVLLVLLLTAYDLAYNRKEYNLRLILGADKRELIKSKIVYDLGGLSLAFLLAFLILLFFTRPSFKLGVSLLSFFIILMINSLLILKGMQIQRAKPLAIQSPKRILLYSLALKALVAVLAILILSTNLALILEGVKLYRQKEYYEKEEASLKIQVDYPYEHEKIEHARGSFEVKAPLDTKEQVQDNLLRFAYQKLHASLLYSHSYQKLAPKYGKKYIFANLEGLRPYKDSIPDWETIKKAEGNFILLPKDGSQEKIMSEFYGFSNLIGFNEENPPKVLTYEKGLLITAAGRRDGEYDYSYQTKNPIIILDSHDYGKLPMYTVRYSLHEPEALNGIIYQRLEHLLQFIRVDNHPAKFTEFKEAISGDAIQKQYLEISTENLRDWFNGLWALQNRSLLISILLSILVLVLELQVTQIVLRIAYETKSKELTVKKVLGYSLLERYSIFFLSTTLISVLALAFAIGIYLFSDFSLIHYMIYGSLILWLLDSTILYHLTRKNDQLEIQRVLKGGI